MEARGAHEGVGVKGRGRRTEQLPEGPAPEAQRVVATQRDGRQAEQEARVGARVYVAARAALRRQRHQRQQ